MSNFILKNAVFFTIKDTLNANEQIKNSVNGTIFSDHNGDTAQNHIKVSFSDVKQISDFKAKGNVKVSICMKDGDLEELSDFVDNAINEKWLIGTIDNGQIANIFLRKNSIKVDARKDNTTFGYQFYAILEDNLLNNA